MGGRWSETKARVAVRRVGIAMLVAFVGLGGLPMVPGTPDASADFGAGQAARYNKNVNGDFLLVGNTVLKCSGSGCTDNNTVNDDLNMSNNDPDGNGALFNGSSATFTIPSGSVVDAAYLYWGGNLGTSRSSGTVFYCADDHSSVSNATSDKSVANTVQLKVGAGSYSTITANTVYTQPTGGLSQSLPSGSSDDGLVYEGVTDVTSSFASVTPATSVSVSVANIQTMQGENCHAGWSLTVVYRFPALNCLTGANDNTGGGANLRNDYRNVAIYDGLLRQQDGAADTTTTLSGFLTASPGPDDLRLGVLAWEGDQFLTGDQMKVKSNLSGSATTVDPAGPSGTGNFFDSGKQTSADHNADLDANPDSGATIQQGYTGGRGDGHGIDAKTQVVQVPGGTSSIDVTFTTDSDQYYPGQFALSSPLTCLLIVEKDQAVNGTPVPRDNATSPAPYVKSGDVITYTMPIRVAGDVDLSSVTLTDAIPAGTSLVAGSIKIGKGGTAAAALSALAAGGSFSAGTVTAGIGTLNNLTAGTCAGGETCYAAVRFDVTVGAVAPGTVITNTAKATFTASGIAINEISNPVTDKVGALLTISKTISGAIAGDPTSFSFTVVCNGSQIAGSPVSLTNGQSVTLGVLPGAACTVTEQTNANFAVSVSGAIATNGGSTTMSQNQSVAFTNTRRFGKIVVNKTTVPVAGDPVAAPTFQFTVACPAVAGYPRSLTVVGSGTAETPSDIPFGTNCTVTETATPGWAQSGAQSVQPVDQAVENVSFTNTRQTGSLIVNKSTVGGDGTFDFTVACDGTAWDVTRSITTAGGTGQSTAVTGIPAGVNCTVTETQQTGWTQTAAPAGPLTIVAGQQATASFTNTRQTADLVITKAVSGTYLLPVSGSFQFTVDCGVAGTFSRTISASNTANGTATVSGIPVGTSCTVTETVPSGWALDGSVVGNTNGRQVTIATQDNNVTFTNKRDVGTITIAKSIDQGSGTFRFDLTCGGTPVSGSPFDITINAPSTTGSLVVGNIPTGSNCVVDENPNGGTSGDFVQVTPSNNGVVTFASTGAAQTASFVNQRKVGDLVIKKVFPPNSLGDPAEVFTFQWDCGPQPRTIGLKAGEQHTVSGIPTGTPCNVSETANASYTTTVAPTGGAVTIGTGTNTVTFTNARKTGTVELRKTLVPASDPGRFDLNLDGGAAEATAVGDGGTTGERTVAIGSHAIAEAVTAGNGAVLGDYTATVACVDVASVTPVPVTNDGNVVVAEGARVVCTFTNARKTGSLKLTKVVVDPLQSGHTFDLFAGQTLVVDNATNGSTGSTTANTGTVTVSETGANLADYASAIACTSNGQPSASGNGTSLQVSVAAGAQVECTFTNTRRTGTLEVRKALSPTDDPGTFDLSIDGTVRKAAATHNGTTGAVTVAPGTHTVAEAGANGTDLSSYSAALSCVDTANNDAAVAAAGGNVAVAAGGAVVCTFTNTRLTGNLTLTKVVVDPLGSNHTFDLFAGSTLVVDEATNGSTGSATVNTGTVTVSETGANLADYASSIACTVDGQTLASGSGTSLAVQLSAGAKVVCTFTNTRRTGTLEVRKALSPTNDPGTFDLSIDGTVRKAAATHNGTTGAVTVAPGTHAVAEAGAAGTDLGDYAATLACVDGAGAPVASTGGSVAVAAGADVVCTFTNTRKTGNLTLTKVIVDPLGANNTFDLLAGQTVVVDEATNGSTASTAVNTGSVTVSETGAALGQYTTSIVCVGADDRAAGTTNNGTSLTIQIGADESVTCTFTNTRRTGTLEVRKALSPTNDPGTFDLSIDGTVRKAAATHNGTTGAVTVAPGAHTVAEAGAAGTDLGDYAATLACRETVSDQPVAAPSGTVAVGAGEVVVCTFTNTRRTGNLTLTKVLVDPLQSGHTFDLYAGQTLVVDDATNGSTGSTTANTGTVTVSETGANLADYTTSIACTSGGDTIAAGSGTSLAVTLAADAKVVCTFTNTRRTGTLEVRKALSPTDDPGTFDLSIDGTVRKAAAGHGDTTGAVTVAPGAHTVAEAAANLGDYNPTLSCIDGAGAPVTSTDGNVGVAAGADVVCTFTNTRRTGNLTLTKVVVDPLQSGDTFDLLAGKTVVVDEAVDGSSGTIAVNSGSVTVSETGAALAGYTTSIVCVGDDDRAAGTTNDGTSLTIQIGAGEPVTCTFTNTRKTGTIEVRKALSPTDDPGTFDLSIDGTVRKAGAGHGGTTGALTVAPGTHTVAEAGAAGTDLGEYAATLACRETVSDEALMTADGQVAVGAGEVVVCTFTNTRRTGDLTLTKVVVDPLQSGDTFDLLADQMVVVDEAVDGSSGSAEVESGTVTVSETGANLAGYTSAIVCREDDEVVAQGAGTSLQVEVTGGSEIECTFTNTRTTGTLEVRKALSPTDDPGTFDLSIDGTVRKAAATHNGTTGAVTVAPGTHTVAEAAAAGTAGDEYTASLACVDTSVVSKSAVDASVEVVGDTVTVAAGATVICTFTNTRKPADLTVTKSPGSSWVLPGGVATFTVVVSNADGGGTAHDVVVTDPLPDGVTFLSSQGDICGVDGISCTIGDLAPGETVTFTVSYAVPSDTFESNVHNEVTVSSPDDPESPGDDADIPIARMKIEKSGTPASYASVGDVLTYSYVVVNIGGAELTGVTVADDRIDSADIDCNWDDEGNGQPFSLDPGAWVVCTAAYTVTAADLLDDAVVNVATADSDQTDPKTDTWSIPRAAMSIEKVATTDGPFALGDAVTYEITVTNTGAATLHGVHITDAGVGAALDDECPAGPDGDGVTLLPGAKVVCEATHTITQADFDAGEYVNVAVGSSDETPDVDDTETVPTPDPAVDLAITKTLSSSSLVAGQEATYQLVVKNNGPATAKGIEVTDTLPAGLTPLNATGSGWTCAADGQKVTCTTAATPAAGESLPAITLTVRVSATLTGSVTNTGVVDGTQVDRDPSNNSSSVTNAVTVVAAATTIATTTTTTTTTAAVRVEPAVVARPAAQSDTPLATTGGTVSWMLIVAGCCMVAGSLTLAARRRRRW